METTYSSTIDDGEIISAQEYLGECIQKLFYKHNELESQGFLYHYTDIEALLNGIIVPNPDP